MMSEIRHGQRPRSRWAARLAAATVVVAVVLGIPAATAATAATAAAAAAAAAATTATTTAAQSAQSPVAAQDRAASTVGLSPSSLSEPLGLVRTGTGVRVRGATTTSASASRQSRGRLFAQVGEARRTDGRLGQWVVGVLLSILVVLWVVLVAVVVRAHMRFAQSAAGGPSGEGRVK